MPREGTGFQNVHRSICHIYLNHVTCHPVTVTSLPEILHVSYLLESGLRVRGSLCRLQRHPVSLQKIPLGLSFPKTQMDRHVEVVLGIAADRCDVLSHSGLVDKPWQRCSTHLCTETIQLR